MPKFTIVWKEYVTQEWYLEVEAENEEEAEKIYKNGDHVTGDEILNDTDFINSEFVRVEK